MTNHERQSDRALTAALDHATGGIDWSAFNARQAERLAHVRPRRAGAWEIAGAGVRLAAAALLLVFTTIAGTARKQSDSTRPFRAAWLVRGFAVATLVFVLIALASYPGGPGVRRRGRPRRRPQPGRGHLHLSRRGLDQEVLHAQETNDHPADVYDDAAGPLILRRAGRFGNLPGRLFVEGG